MRAHDNTGIDPRHSSNTSDHTYQSVRVQLSDPDNKKLLALRGATWNLLDRCYSKQTNSNQFANNPWNSDESVSEYLGRKERQLAKIISILTNQDQGPKEFMLLQEIDVLLRPPKNANQDELERYRQISDGFRSQLADHGFRILMPEIIEGISQQPAAIIYHAESLELIPDTERGVLRNDRNQFRGFEAEFLHQHTQRNVTLVCLQLDYDEDYTEAIPAYQETKAAMDKFTIMGGDTNHAPNHAIVGLINNWNNITNVHGTVVDGEVVISSQHGDKVNVQKCYDGFLVNPTSETKVIIAEEKGEVFSRKNTGEWCVSPLDPKVSYPAHCTHQSPVGKAWARGAVKPSIDNQNATSIAPRASLFSSHHPDQPIVMYKARRGGIAIRFPDKVMRDLFLKETGSSRLPTDAPKHEGDSQCPHTFLKMPDTVYLPFYTQNDGTLSILFATTAMRDKVSQLLGLDKLGARHESSPEIVVKNGTQVFKDIVTEIKLPQTKELKELSSKAPRPKVGF